MATIKTDPQTTKNIIKDITTTQLCSYQLGHKYKLSKITIDRIGREHLGTDIYSRREKLVFASLSKQITELRSKNYTMSAIAEYLGISKSSIFAISQKIDHEAGLSSVVGENEVQLISIESNAVESAGTPAKITSAPVKVTVSNLKTAGYKRDLFSAILAAVAAFNGSVDDLDSNKVSKEFFIFNRFLTVLMDHYVRTVTVGQDGGSIGSRNNTSCLASSSLVKLVIL